MDRFLDQLASQARSRPQPTLAERAVATARELGRREGRREDDGTVLIERRPDSPPIDPYSLELYLDALVKKLNRSAAYVANEPRTKGRRQAAVHMRLNPDGSLKSFEVVNPGDQQAEIAHIRQVVERAVPFSAFPPDLRRSAASLGMTICILPPGADGGGFGFSRLPPGRSC